MIGKSLKQFAMQFNVMLVSNFLVFYERNVT